MNIAVFAKQRLTSTTQVGGSADEANVIRSVDCSEADADPYLDPHVYLQHLALDSARGLLMAPDLAHVHIHIHAPVLTAPTPAPASHSRLLGPSLRLDSGGPR